MQNGECEPLCDILAIGSMIHCKDCTCAGDVKKPMRKASAFYGDRPDADQLLLIASTWMASLVSMEKPYFAP
ncbi:hypothetical protein FB597_10398 [Herbaspirillum sp. SJZ099]|nr:hypothetical protein FB597_10398 [Herbaspirillum sp. SJZ099]